MSLKQPGKESVGDTLVEVLLSVSILGLVLVVSFASASRSLNAGTDAANRNRALDYARAQVELLRDAANSGTIGDLPSDGSAFCINPSTDKPAQPDQGGFCHLSGQDPFGVVVKYNQGNQTYSITSQWQGRTSKQQVFLYYQVPQSPITAAPAVDISISASPKIIAPGQSATVTWTSTTALNCQASGGWSGAKAPEGSQKVDNINSSTIFTLTCTGLDGVSTLSRSAQVYVSGQPAPTINFTATPSTVASGGSSTLSWSVGDSSGCTASDGWSGSRATTGTAGTGALNSDKTFTLTCESSSGGPSAQASVVVSVMSTPSVTLSASPSSIEYYQGTTLTWKISGATSCSASSNSTWSGSIAPADGNTFVNHLSSGTKNFTLSCTNAGGTKSASTSVFVNNNPGFCIDVNYGGGCTYFSHDVADLRSYGLNDTISSVLVPPGRREIMYKNANFSGSCYLATSNVADISGTDIGNDALSSFYDKSGGSGC